MQGMEFGNLGREGDPFALMLATVARLRRGAVS